ncbi:multicopper oxidase [Aaosphaeria arxii CBS 175.79]|uniref:Multicopper oxidase n=1 Tax=Aaosphaeria arxii CBS 175.79 TaxID=1450172 RepID=A0A6A5XPD7_9PLEO|nr:multicopper oxidase [Aaosphaeria arxii CBS 175.79]KAF2015125.1 multicopper oxidase [Aaosphaeria arxii CBS 175.79]
MKTTLRQTLQSAVPFLLLANLCTAKTVTYDFNVTWVTANPDGLADRKVVGINGQWPLPIIEVEKGDQLVVNMHNGLDKASSIHFHGMYQNTTTEMDGPAYVTQCPVPPGMDITYNFTVNQNGTYWYHCHTEACYPDGYRQALLVHDKDAYFNENVEEEFTITLSDWYHRMTESIEPEFLSLYNPTGAEPIPQSFLFNDTLGTSISVQPGKKYLLRLINVGAFVAQYFYIEDHEFTIVEVDGIYTEPKVTDLIYISAAQRYTILLETKNSTDKNYPIVTVADSTLLDLIPSDLQLNHTDWLEYNKDAAHDEAVMKVEESSELVPADDAALVPYDRQALLPEPDLEITLSVVMDNLINGFGYAFFDNISYTHPKVPTLFTVMSAAEDQVSNAEIYGEFTHPIVLEHNQVVQIVLNNADTGSHPFHLHGHAFQVIDRYPPQGEHFYELADVAEPVEFDPNNHTAFPEYPIRRDTLVIPPQGYLVIRFVADNPGVWLFHCHIDWHLMQGLALTLIEAPDQIRERVKIPQNHYDVCSAAGVAVQGNAAGNTQDYLNLQGQPRQPAWLPAGFTPRGIVALTFTILAALLGLASIVIYGLSDLTYGKEDSSLAGDSQGPLEEPGSTPRETVEAKRN